MSYTEQHSNGTTLTGSVSGLIGNIVSMSHSGMTVNMEDVTDLDGTEDESSVKQPWRRFIEGLVDAGEITLELNMTDDTADDLIQLIAAAPETWTMLFPDSGKVAADGFFTSVSPFNLDMDNPASMSGTIKLSGSVAIT